VVTRGVVFDMDDTLYSERDYVRSGFGVVAQHAASTTDEATILFAWLWSAFEAGRRDDTIDGLFGAFPSPSAQRAPFWSTRTETTNR